MVITKFTFLNIMKIKYIKLIFSFTIISIIIIISIIFINNKIISNYKNSGFYNFSINITLDKENFVQGENVWVTVKVKNISNKIDSLPHLDDISLAEYMSLHKINPYNTELFNYRGGMDTYIKVNYVTFQPNEERIFDLNLQWCYGDTLPKNAKPYFEYFTIGTYEIWEAFRDFTNITAKPILSNKLTFNISRPTGSEYEDFKKLIRINGIPDDKSKPHFKTRIDAYIDFFRRNPKSIYAENFISHSATERSITKYKYDESYISDALTFINNFPNSRIINGLIYSSISIQKNYKNNDEIKEFWKNIGKQFPDTRTSIAVDENLNKIDDIKKNKND